MEEWAAARRGCPHGELPRGRGLLSRCGTSDHSQEPVPARWRPCSPPLLLHLLRSFSVGTELRTHGDGSRVTRAESREVCFHGAWSSRHSIALGLMGSYIHSPTSVLWNRKLTSRATSRTGPSPSLRTADLETSFRRRGGGPCWPLCCGLRQELTGAAAAGRAGGSALTGIHPYRCDEAGSQPGRSFQVTWTPL